MKTRISAPKQKATHIPAPAVETGMFQRRAFPNPKEDEEQEEAMPELQARSAVPALQLMDIPLYPESTPAPSPANLDLQREVEEDYEEDDTLQKPVQAKLTIGQPGDKYEQEADAMAAKVMRMPDSAIQREPEDEEEDMMQLRAKPQIQAKGSEAPAVPDGFANRLSQNRSGGKPLSDETRSFMEPRFGSDFSNVRVHETPDLANSIQAQAFTHGQDIYFNSGKYNPSSSSGKELLAHELTHTQQQVETVQRQIPETYNLAYRREIAEQLISELRDKGGITVAFYVAQLKKIKQHKEFKRQAVQYASDHNAWGLVDGVLTQGKAMELTESAPTKLENLFSEIDNLLNLYPDLTESSSIPRTVNTLAIFTHGFNRRLQAGKNGEMIATEDKAEEQSSRARRENWTNLENWIAALTPFLSPSPTIPLFACSVSGQPDSGIPFAEALQYVLQSELEKQYTGQATSPTVWGHTTSGHTTANRQLVGFGGNNSGEKYDLISDISNKLVESIIRQTSQASSLTDDQLNKLKRQSRRLISRSLKAKTGKQEGTNVYIREIPQMGIERVWNDLTSLSSPNFSDLNLSESATSRLSQGFQEFRKRIDKDIESLSATLIKMTSLKSTLK